MNTVRKHVRISTLRNSQAAKQEQEELYELSYSRPLYCFNTPLNCIKMVMGDVSIYTLFDLT